MLPGDTDAPARMLHIPEHEFSDARLRSAYIRAVALAERFGETAAFLVTAETAPEQLAPGFAERLVEEVDLAATKLEKHHAKEDAIELDIVRAVDAATYPDIAGMQALQSFVDLTTGRKPLPGWDPDLYRDHRRRVREDFERRWNLPLDANTFEAAVETWRDGPNDETRMEAIVPLLASLSKREDAVPALLKKWTRHRRSRRPPGRPRKKHR